MKLNYTFSRERFFPGFDGEYCKMYPAMVCADNGNAFLFYTMLKLSGSDTVHDSYSSISVDGGKTFNQPKKMKLFQKYENGIREIVGRDTVFFHKKHKKIVVFAGDLKYEHEKHPVMDEFGICYNTPYYMFVDSATGDYTSDPIELKMPIAMTCARPHGQPIEEENGDILMTFYGSEKGDKMTNIYVARIAFDGQNMTVKEMGKPIIGLTSRGFAEPSMAKIGDKYYMTIRSDDVGLFAESDDGLNFTEVKPWKWDDGTILENYNTMQRWVRHKDALYLVYTRRGAHNDHVFRHRAPLFMTRFDHERECLVREEEVILVPELGARLGNFTVTDVSEKEFWVLTAEWMQTWAPHEHDWRRCTQYGSDNTIWRAKVVFE